MKDSIVIYQGTYIKSTKKDGNSNYVTYDFDINGKYKVYIDLETEKIYNIDIDKCREFEDSHLTIYPLINAYSTFEYYSKFLEIKNYFNKELTIKTRNEVISDLIKKYGIKYNNEEETFKKYIQDDLIEKSYVKEKQKRL